MKVIAYKHEIIFAAVSSFIMINRLGGLVRAGRLADLCKWFPCKGGERKVGGRATWATWEAWAKCATWRHGRHGAAGRAAKRSQAGRKKSLASPGFDPGTLGLWAQCANHCATMLLPDLSKIFILNLRCAIIHTQHPISLSLSLIGTPTPKLPSQPATALLSRFIPPHSYCQTL